MKALLKKILPAADLVLAPFVYPAAWLLKKIRMLGVQKFPFCKSALMRVGVFPIYDHYFEPQFDNQNPRADYSQDRFLPGIDWNVSGQLNMLTTLTFADELKGLPRDKKSSLEYYLNNGSFESGDAEYWYQIIRRVKPQRIIEVGSGNSTLMAVKAVAKNREEDHQYKCEHICIEPFEMPWLEELGITVIRKKVEELDVSFFSSLQENDILFIDSTHIIRPQGDVLFEYLELLPSLNKGVIVHVHDIFSPKNYPKKWLVEFVSFWNEQYLLEAFLSHSNGWKIIGALNFLQHNHYDALKKVAPYISTKREPGSFYIQKLT
jgi:hypothetical protein